MSPYVLLAIAVGSSTAIATAFGHAYVSRLHYRFLQHAYDKGGTPDLIAAAEATRDRGDDPPRTGVIGQHDQRAEPHLFSLTGRATTPDPTHVVDQRKWGRWMAAFVEIATVTPVAATALFALLRSGHVRAVVRSIFSRPRTESILIKIGDRWVDIRNTVDASRGPMSLPRHRHRRSQHDGPVHSGYDSRNGGPDDHG